MKCVVVTILPLRTRRHSSAGGPFQCDSVPRAPQFRSEINDLQATFAIRAPPRASSGRNSKRRRAEANTRSTWWRSNGCAKTS